MKNNIKLILILISILIISCSKDEDSKIAGLEDFSGKFRLSNVRGIDACTNSSSTKQSTSSSNDLEILSDGRFKKKKYELDSNNNCVVTEILEGQISITSSYYNSPRGIVEYDNSGKTARIIISKSINRKHNEIEIYDETENGSTFSYSFGRSDQ